MAKDMVYGNGIRLREAAETGKRMLKNQSVSYQKSRTTKYKKGKNCAGGEGWVMLNQAN